MSAAAIAHIDAATREILVAWDRSADQWRDSQSQYFQKTWIEPVPEVAVQAREAMTQLEILLRKIKNDCE